MSIYSKAFGEDSVSNENTEIVLRPRIGQQITLHCVELNNDGENGSLNPPAQLLFTKNGIAVGFPKHWENKMSFKASSDDSGAAYNCEAQNKLGKEVSNAILLDIQRKSVTINGSYIFFSISFIFYFTHTLFLLPFISDVFGVFLCIYSVCAFALVSQTLQQSHS